MSSYSYRPLSPGCIRLLRLSPHEDEAAPVHCSLLEYSLSPQRRGTHLYEALSYCWGSPEKSQTVLTDAGSLHVTRNLHAALVRLRDAGLERVIWIDAICINQDDADEKGQQVRLMTEIYARASRVVVWLENLTGDHLVDSDAQANDHRALQAMQAAAIVSLTTPPDSRISYRSPSSRDKKTAEERLAVERLFERPWFRRIWVLQEIAAARHILMMGKSAEIDGHAFCLGFDQIEPFPEDKESRMRARSTISLIKNATIRSKCAVSGSGGLSLQILPLGHLVELYHQAREATDRRDMVYALLGMSTDAPIGLVPDYRISWKHVFHRLLRSLLSDHASITTYDEHATAVIKTKGCVIGKVQRNRDSSGQELILGDWFRSENFYPGRSKPFVQLSDFQGMMSHVERGDLICFLQGAPLPTIVRMHKDYCSIIAIVANAEVGDVSWWHNKMQSDFLLVWEWKPSGKRATEFSTFNSFLNDRGLSCNISEMPDDLNIAMMLLEAQRVAVGLGKLVSLMAAYEDAGQNQHPSAVAASRLFDQIVQGNRLSLPEMDRGYRAENLKTLCYFASKIRGNTNVIEDLMIEAAHSEDAIVFLLEACGHRITITEKIIEAASRKSLSLLTTRLLFEHAKDKVPITENIIVAAVESARSHPRGMKVLKYLLESADGQIVITETILVAAVTGDKAYHSPEVVELLLENREDQITITENILVATAKIKLHERGKKVMQLFFSRKRLRDQIVITENVLIAAAAKSDVLDVLFKERRDEITVTENVLMAAVAPDLVNPHAGLEVLLEQKGDQITMTENFLMAALSVRFARRNTMELLLEFKGDQITVTEKMIEMVEMKGDTVIRSLLLKHKNRNKDF